MIALVGAMFVAMGSASAAGQCRESGGVITLGFGQTCTVAHPGADDTDVENVAPAGAVTAPLTAGGTDDAVVTITAVGTAVTTTDAKVTVTEYGSDNAAGNAGPPNGTDDTTIEYTVRVVGFAIAKAEVVGDQDNTVAAGPRFTARVTVRSPGTGAQVRVTVPTTGLSLVTTGTGAETTQSRTIPLSDADTTDGVATAEVAVNTAGAPAGEYTITFLVDDTGFADNEGDPPVAPAVGERASIPLKVTIGDPGTGLASATLSLGNSVEDTPYTADNEAKAETGTDSATGDGINLVIETFDSNGGKANGGSIDQIIIIAPGGQITAVGRHDVDAGTVGDQQQSSSSSLTLDEDVTAIGQRTGIRVGKANGKPGTVTVYAIISGPGGAVRTEDLTLNFSGPTSSIAVADATDTLRSVNAKGDDPATTATEAADNVIEDEITLAVTGEDEGGIASDPGSGYNITITDPDGTRVNSDKIEAELGAYTAGRSLLTVTGKGSQSAPLKAGVYTVKLTSGKLEASAKFAVAGPADTVMLDVSEPDESGRFTVTATAYDADDNPVVDGTPVTFDTADQRGDFDPVLHVVRDSGTTEAGMAKGTYVEIGPGRATIIVTVGDVTQIARHISMYGAEDEAAPEPVVEPEMVGNHCIENKGGFAVWTCGVSAMASEVFALVQPEGATAIHLWSTISMSWVRYSVVDGTTVPGSSDFMVTEDDILYISN